MRPPAGREAGPFVIRRPDLMTSTSIAVVIPTYNRSRYLARAVRSALAQTRRPDQLIVVDDGSTDDTADVLGELGREGRVDVVALPHCGVPGRVRNAGLARVTTSHVAFLDSDDEWLPHKLERQAHLLATHERARVICGNATIVESDGAAHAVYFDLGRRWPPPIFDERTLTGANPVITSTALVRVDAVRAVGGFAAERRLFAVEDFHLWARLLRDGFGVYAPEPVALYRLHSAGASRNRADNAIRRLFAVRSLARSAPPQSVRRWRTALGRQYAECAAWSRGLGRDLRARRLLARARQLAGWAPLRWAGVARSYAAAWRIARQDRG
jgi:glycosyltransferase involved in cell wall biosynthesis